MITVEQNTKRQLQRLGAQRDLYANTKSIFGWQLFMAGPLTVVLSIIVIIHPPLKALAAVWGITLTLADLFWLTPWQKRLRDTAARIQEAFDCDVLELSWNELKVGKKPDPELVKEASDNYKSWAADMTPIKNWYSTAVAELPIHIGRIACQRSNCWWDSEQRRRYAVAIIASVTTVFLVLFGLSFFSGLTLENFILKVIAPVAPALLLGIRQYNEQTEAATRLDKLKAHAEKLWDMALSGKDASEISAGSRNLQDEIFENRKKSPPVFDFIFKQLRPSYEQRMNFGVEELVAEAKKRGFSSSATPPTPAAPAQSSPSASSPSPPA